MNEFVVVQEVWYQTSAEYDAVRTLRTLLVKPETTVAEIMAWAQKGNALGRGDVVITEQDK